jgi:hypothetical protein
LYQDRDFKTVRTVPAHFCKIQSTFDLPRSVLTANFSFGISKSALAAPKHLWKPQKCAGTVPALFTPL